MPTVLTPSYFTGKLFIPNSIGVPDIGEPYGDAVPSNTDKLANAIEKYERILLVNALGNGQYQELLLHLSDPDGKWYNLINGQAYDNKVWNGIKDVIAYYVYVNFLKYDNTQYNTTGIERVKGKNAVSVEPIYRLIDMWNEFVGLYQHTDCFCPCSLFPWFYGGWFEDYGKSNFVSLYAYLEDNKDIFNVDLFRFYRTQNVLGV